MKATLLYGLLLYIECAFTDSADDLAKSEIFYNCPEDFQSNENPWCVNCTFFDERKCIKSDEHTSTLYTYKLYECSNSSKQVCVLPVSWKVHHRSFLASSVSPMDNLPYYDIKLKFCDDYGNDKLNPTCSNCTALKDDYCLFNLYGIICQTREFKCPEYDRSCHIFHNCTAPVVKLPNFIPKLGLDGKELEQKKECTFEDIQPIKENPACTNCLFMNIAICNVYTKYSRTRSFQYIFECPLNDGKKCVLPHESETFYSKKLEGVTICPDIRENPNCQNCTNQKSVMCSTLDYANKLGVTGIYKLYSYTCADNTKCFSDKAKIPEFPVEFCCGIGGPSEDLSQFIKPAILASLSG